MIIKTLTLENFLKYPVWQEDEGRDYYLPVLNPFPLPDQGKFLHIRVDCKTCLEHYLVGYLVDPTHDGHTYCMGLFCKGQEFIFNRNLLDFAQFDVEKLASLLNCETGDIFPIHFLSEFSFPNSSSLSGIFTLPIIE